MYIILIHLHDAIDKAWTSPSTLTIRKGMELKFGVLVSFTDGDYGDLSFYPDMEKDLSSDGKKYFQIPFPPPQTPAKYDTN